MKRLSLKKTNRLVAAFAAMLFALGIGILTTSSASATIKSSSHQAAFDGNPYGYEIRNAWNECLGILNESKANGAAAVQWPCDGQPDQAWQMYCQPNSGGCEYVNQNSNKCLGVLNESTANGAAIIQWDCWNGPDQNWRWIHFPNGGNIQNYNTNFQKCLGIDGDNPAEGTPAIQWDCNGNNDQQWHQT